MTARVAPGPAVGPRSSPVLGFVGLGLAVLGTILACIPAVFGIGVLVLLGAFVVSLIGLFKKNAAKWPSIVGLILSVIGGAIGTVVLVVALVVNAAGPVDPIPPTDSSPSTQQPSEPPSTGTTEGRPSPDVIAEKTATTFRADGITSYDDMPDFYPCLGQQLYDSDVSDESLWLVITGADPMQSERALAEKVLGDAILACDPNGEGAF